MKIFWIYWVKNIKFTLFLENFLEMIMGTRSITCMAQPVFLLGNLASGDLRENETRSHLCLFPWFQRKVLIRGG